MTLSQTWLLNQVLLKRFPHCVIGELRIAHTFAGCGPISIVGNIRRRQGVQRFNQCRDFEPSQGVVNFEAEVGFLVIL